MVPGICEPGWIRTIDTRLKRAVLYQLSYGPVTAVRGKAQRVRRFRRALYSVLNGMYFRLFVL